MASGDLTVELGATGLEQLDGFVHDEKLKQLQRPDRRLQTYREMGDNEPVLGALLFAIEMLIKRVIWNVEGDDDRRDFIESAFEDLSTPFEDVVSELLSFLQFGFSLGEVTLKRRLGPQPEIELTDEGKVERPDNPSSLFNDGRWGWHKIVGRSQASVFKWIFDEPTGEILGFVQQAPPKFKQVPIPMSKLVHLRTTIRSNNPEGRSILRSAFRPWYFKKVMEDIQAIGVERDLAGLPVLYVPDNLMETSANRSDAESTQRTALQTLLRNIRRGSQEGILIPGGRDANGNRRYELSLLTTGGRRQFDVKGLLEYYDRRMATPVLADFILMGHEKVGSLALSSDKTEMFATAIGAWLDTIATPFNRRQIPQLLRVNGMPEENAPKLVHGDIESISIAELGQYVSDLSGAGMPLFPDEDLEGHLRLQAGLPEPSEEALARDPARADAG